MKNPFDKIPESGWLFISYLYYIGISKIPENEIPNYSREPKHEILLGTQENPDQKVVIRRACEILNLEFQVPNPGGGGYIKGPQKLGFLSLCKILYEEISRGCGDS